MTDNSISYWSGHYYHSVVNDGFTANNHFYSTYYWKRDYPGIRGCNQFILNAKAFRDRQQRETGRRQPPL